MVTGQTLNHLGNETDHITMIFQNEIFINGKPQNEFLAALAKDDFKKQIISRTLCIASNRATCRELLSIASQYEYDYLKRVIYRQSLIRACETVLPSLWGMSFHATRDDKEIPSKRGIKKDPAAYDELFFADRENKVVRALRVRAAGDVAVQGALATLLLLIFSQFEKQFDLAIFAEWLFYLLIATTVFVYRRKRPDLARPYKVWGYPLLPLTFCICGIPVLVYCFLGNLIGSLLGAALILLGVPVLWLVQRQYGASVSIMESQSE